MPTLTVYIETTVVSYLTAGPGRDLVVAAHQQVTREWWDTALPLLDPYISPIVIEEITRGDEEAARKRLDRITGFPVLEVTEEVRDLAVEWELPIWDKPATPCLSSRVAYGEEVTPERLAMIDKAERFLRERGFRTVRVRYHKGDLARLEVPEDQLADLCAPEFRELLSQQLKSLGFKFVTVDLEGFRSGSLNALVQIAASESNPHGRLADGPRGV